MLPSSLEACSNVASLARIRLPPVLGQVNESAASAFTAHHLVIVSLPVLNVGIHAHMVIATGFRLTFH